MKCFLLSFLIGILTPAFLSGQCPERKALWDRILFLRDSSVQSLDQQLQELLPYLQQMKNCPYANDSTHALLLQRLGALYFLQSDYVTGIRYTRESIGIIYQQLGKPSVNPRHLIKSYNNLRICYDSLKQQNLKLQAIDSCIAVSLRLHTGYEYALPLLYERILNLIESGDYYRCIQYALIAETLARNYGYSIDNRLSFITWRINALILLKRYQEADELAASKIDECRKAGSTASLGALYALRGTAVQESGDLNKALDLYQKAFYFDARINNRPGCAGTLNNTGYLLYFKQLKQFNNALHYYQRALEYAGPGESLNIFDNIANVYVAKKQFDSAFYFFQKAFDQIRPGGNERDLLLHTGTYMNSAITEYISNLVLDKADAYLARYRDLQEEDKLNDAIRTYKIIDQFFDKIKLSQIEIQSKLFWRKHIQRLYENAIEACFLRGNIPDALYFFEKNRAVLLSDQINEQHHLKDTDILTIAQARKSVLELEQKSRTGDSSSPGYSSLQQELFLRRQDLAKLEQQVKAKYPLYYQSFLDTTMISLEVIRRELLRNHDGMIELFNGSAAVYSLLVTPTGASLYRIPKSDFDSTVTRFNSYLSDAGRINAYFPDFRQTAAHLYQLIFGDHPAPRGRIIVSPDSPFFPFDALVTSKAGQPLTWFLNDQAVSYTYSARFLLNNFESGAQGRGFMGMAPGKYPSSFSLSPLGGSDQSLARIAGNFGNALILQGTKASRGNFMQEFYQYRIIQLYTHAADSSKNNEPVIYFADSVLYLSELIGEYKPATRLIVLSACETGLGKHYEGEGVFSLNRGFAAMGVPSSVTYLWAVENEPTYALTELFYKYLSKGLPLDEALQQAKLEFLRVSGKEQQLPVNWAAAILVGKTDRIHVRKRTNLLYYAGAIILLSLVILTVVVAKKRRRST